MQLDLNEEQMRTLISGAILQHLSPERREALIQQAIAGMFKVDPYNKQTPIQQAFEQSVRVVMADILKEQLEKDTKFHEQISGLIREATERVMDGERREVLIAKMTNQLAGAFTLDRY